MLPCLKKKEPEKKKEEVGTQFIFYDQVCAFRSFRALLPHCCFLGQMSCAGCANTLIIPFSQCSQYGILRKGVATDDGMVHNRDEELERVLKLENGWSTFTEEEQRTWYVVESGWIRTWLSYVRFGTASLGEALSSPAPGPINNECLLLMTADTETPVEGEGANPRFKWLCKAKLLPANKDGQGHYRRVNCKVWEAFCDMYKGCGPAIKYVEPPPPPEPEAAPGKSQGADGAAVEKAAGAAAEAAPTEAAAAAAAAPAKKVSAKEAAKAKAEAVVAAAAAAKAEAEASTRWQNPDLWELDQDQARFAAKYSEKTHPNKSPEERRELMQRVWESKRLRADRAEKDAEETAAAAAEGAAASDASNGAGVAAPGAEEGKDGDSEGEGSGEDNEDDAVGDLQASLLSSTVSESVLEDAAAGTVRFRWAQSWEMGVRCSETQCRRTKCAGGGWQVRGRR